MPTFTDFLAQQHADNDVVQQALRYYIADRFPDVTPEDMHAALVGEDRLDAVSASLARLEQDPGVVDAVALFVLSAGWDEDGEARESVRDAILEAKGKMPLIEVAVVSVSCVYGVYLLVTRNVKRSETRVVRRKDGSFETRTVTEYHDPQGALGAIVDVFRPRRRNEELSSGENPEP